MTPPMSDHDLIKDVNYWVLCARPGGAIALRFTRCFEALTRLIAENTALHERLEDNHVFDINGNRIEREPGTIPDGIECRDETIKLQRERITALAVQRDALAEEAVLRDKVSREAWGDQSDEHTPAIRAAHPTKTKDFATYEIALAMVGKRHGKYELVDLTNWLLSRALAAESRVTRLIGQAVADEGRVERLEGALNKVMDFTDQVGVVDIVEAALKDTQA